MRAYSLYHLGGSLFYKSTIWPLRGQFEHRNDHNGFLPSE